MKEQLLQDSLWASAVRGCWRASQYISPEMQVEPKLPAFLYIFSGFPSNISSSPPPSRWYPQPWSPTQASQSIPGLLTGVVTAPPVSSHFLVPTRLLDHALLGKPYSLRSALQVDDILKIQSNSAASPTPCGLALYLSSVSSRSLPDREFSQLLFHSVQQQPVLQANVVLELLLCYGVECGGCGNWGSNSSKMSW